MANTGTFKESLSLIPEALKWAEGQDIEELHDFFMDNPQTPMFAFASGGSYSSVDYAALLYETYKGMAKALTPLSMSSVSDDALKSAKILILTSDGQGFDEKYVANRAAKLNPENTCAVVKTDDKNNTVVKTLQRAGSRWFVYDWLTQDRPFIATIDTVCKFGLFNKAFTQDADGLRKYKLDLTPERCFSYAPRKEGDIPSLGNIRNFIVLYNGWSRPVAVDFESKMVESGIASVQLCDYRNFCHGRFIFLSKHLEDSALVLFLTPREQQFAKDLILESTSWRGNTDIFPRNTPILKIETELDSPLASIDLLAKMSVCFNEIAQENGDEPCSPKNPSKIDKRFPKNTPFNELADKGPLGS